MEIAAVRRLVQLAEIEAEALGVTVGEVLLSILLVRLAEQDAEASQEAGPLAVFVVGGVGDDQ